MKRCLLLLLFFPMLLFAQQSKSPMSLPQAALWKDTDGNAINAHGAGVLYHNGVYYLFGEIKKGSTWLVPGQSWEAYRVAAGGVSCYTSTDLVHWQYKGVALAQHYRQPARPPHLESN